MRCLGLLLGMLLAFALPAQAGHSPPKVLVRVHVQTNTGMPVTESRPITIPPDNETIYVRALPEVTEAELIGVQTDTAGAIHLQFDHTGQVNLDAVTAQNQGRIMVVVINGIVVYAPTIDVQLSSGELILPHPLTPEILRLLEQKAADNVKQEKRT